MPGSHEPLRFEVSLDGSTVPVPPAVTADGLPCAALSCFERLVQARATPQTQTVVLAMTNAGFAPFWHNLRCSLERLNVSQHAIIIGTDVAACEAAASDSVPCVVGDEVLWHGDARKGGQGSAANGALSQSAERHGTVAYARLMHIKARPALAVLRMGYHLIFTDTDMVWLRDPIQALRKTHGKAFERGEVDVLIQSDYDASNDAACAQHEHCARSAWCDTRGGRCEEEVCGGFYYLRAAPPAIALLEALFARMEWQRMHVDARIGEQPALNYVLRRTPGLRYRILPRARYPNGNAYFVTQKSQHGSSKAVIVHNNWLAGFEAKKERFVAHGMWYLRDADGTTCHERTFE